MRLALVTIASLLAMPAIATPSADWSARIGSDGLARTETALAGLADPTPDDAFALGAVHFLRGIEQALQLRWKAGATAELAPIPILRLALPPNPAPEPYRASLVTDVFAGLRGAMASAADTLATIQDDSAVGLTVRFADLWFDINGNGTREPDEDLMPLALSAMLNPWEMPETTAPVPVIRFDTADAAWLSAYAHLLSAVSETVLAFDPTKPTEQVLAARKDQIDRLGDATPELLAMLGNDGAIDKAMIAILSLRQTPDAKHTQSARAELLAMIADNRRFWSRVAVEKDNEAEWIPNDRQTGAFGIVLPPNTGATWLLVLSDLQAMLEGKLLVAHWAFPEGSGIDIGAFLDKPAPIDLIGWAHGIDALPYARKGPTLSGGNWRAFESLLSGNSLLYALYLN